MPTHRARSRPPHAPSDTPTERRTATDAVSEFLEDAAHFPGGHAPAVVLPRDEAQLASVLRDAASVLPVGAQSSLTGGATPMGEVVLSLSKLAASGTPAATHITVQPGVTLTSLRDTLTAAGKAYPPVPTYEGATVGGIVSTNAAGAATFKYGTTRDWVRGLTVMLACGELLELERGRVRAEQGRFEIETSEGAITVSVPTYQMPDVPKHSAGYHAAPDMDLIDLFIGSEGTLGVVTSVTLDVLPRRPEVCLVQIALGDEPRAVALASRLRDVSVETRRARDRHGLDVVAIEHMDRRCLELLREEGADRRSRVTIPHTAAVVLLAQVELPHETTAAQMYAEVGLAASPQAPDTPIVRLCRLLEADGLLEATELAAPGDRTRAAALLALREAVPEAVNRRIGIAKRRVDDTIEKTAADMIVPYPRFADSLSLFRDAFESRGLDYAIWGHLSDANLHPNVIPRSAADVRLGQDAILACGREVIRWGGCPLAEHGVGRNPVKQALLRRLYGEKGIEQMRAVKRALDPAGKLAPGVLFPATPGTGRAAP
ncbi:MAG: FAD-binding oxidoreductase [Vicinamibacterales bacterium]|jgi:D-lactate dehydrogenase (cytochrome)|nr:FAD-binding oxidoreductase [Vicinamibacterales bacterium]MDP7477928.1 FAD-binding oxidoreductase [Vicinamibacterales bacterium]MDP7691394.1 FAD-binding oxidoreductase [Vicinamibacterales bacterium]HJN43908.1 FAD-binding oxidoreductase [Vicinamibacterales bacterium]